jgi:hypothetical protein
MANIVEQIKYKRKELSPHKSIIDPKFDAKTVLTNNPWSFVSLWLKREKKEKALFYWNQAETFYKASKGLPLQSAPLLHYYAFMNAVKTLLEAKNITFDEMHGVRSHNTRGPSDKIKLANEGVRIMQRGILPSLSSYYGETETISDHSLEELLFNLPYIHRTFCLTYPRQTEMFIPLINCKYVTNRTTRKAYLSAELSKDFGSERIINRLPISLIRDTSNMEIFLIKSSYEVDFSNPKKPTSTDINNLKLLQQQIRKDISYINGANTLWYAKSNVAGPNRLSRFPTTMTLAAMHRISELCRYRPLELDLFLSGQKNWLLTEFISQAPIQFIDEISSEITGYVFLTPNVRVAT